MSSSSDDLSARYVEAAKVAKERTPPTALSKEQKKAMYCHFKQAEVGPCNIPKPGFFDPVGRSKWDAWNDLGTMSKEEAMKKYIEAVQDAYGEI